MKNINQFPL
jgi:hypothetical protein